jgi:TetR/AcrR family transcriptional repressor of nem operon
MALLDEIGPAQPATRQAFTEGSLKSADEIAARMAPENPRSAHVKALNLLAMMAGTLQLSRALADRRLADEVLEQGIRNAPALFGAAHQQNAHPQEATP